MSILVALFVAVFVFVYWRAALAIVAMIVIALVILGMVTILQSGHPASGALPVAGMGPAPAAPVGGSALIG
jgi:hypothetical protein